MHHHMLLSDMLGLCKAATQATSWLLLKAVLSVLYAPGSMLYDASCGNIMRPCGCMPPTVWQHTAGCGRMRPAPWQHAAPVCGHMRPALWQHVLASSGLLVLMLEGGASVVAAAAATAAAAAAVGGGGSSSRAHHAARLLGCFCPML